MKAQIAAGNMGCHIKMSVEREEEYNAKGARYLKLRFLEGSKIVKLSYTSDI